MSKTYHETRDANSAPLGTIESLTSLNPWRRKAGAVAAALVFAGLGVKGCDFVQDSFEQKNEEIIRDAAEFDWLKALENASPEE